VLDERKLAVLAAIVRDYVDTNEPVGSKALSERHQLGVSPATIRNDMATLEDEGYIAQPHTSAGRVPTNQGYRLFVDRLAAVKPLSAAERRAIAAFLADPVDLDDVMARTVRLLAQLTHQVAVVQYPSIARSTLRHVELLGLGPTRVMMVVIMTTGRVEQRVVDLPGPVDEQVLAELRARLNAAAAGRRLADVAAGVAEAPTAFPVADRPAVALITSTLVDSLSEAGEERVVLGGTANLARFGEDFDTMHPVLEALEEQVVLLRLLGEASAPERVRVRIGHELSVESLAATSVVSVGYGAGEEAVAQLGVLGPTRMDYPGTMGAVRAVARYLGQILAEG